MSDAQSGQLQTFDTAVSWTLQGAPALGAILLNGSGIQAVAGGAAELLGLPEGDNLGLPLEQLPPELLPIVHENLRGTNSKFKRHLEVSLSGRATTLLELTSLVCNGKNEHSNLLLLVRDAGFSTEMRRRLTHLDRLLTLGTLSANISHELRNAFVAVKTFIDLLMEKNQGSELATLVQRELARIEELLSQTLRMAEPAPPSVQVVKLNAILEKTVRVLEPRLRKTGIHLCLRMDALPDELKGVENELQQAFMNLILNAVEAMGTSGELTIRSRFQESTPSEEPHVLVTIKDTGPGISQENQARLFEPFFTTKPGGTGLGLAITRKIVWEHRGTIQVCTNEHGTEFLLNFPATADARRG